MSDRLLGLACTHRTTPGLRAYCFKAKLMIIDRDSSPWVGFRTAFDRPEARGGKVAFENPELGEMASFRAACPWCPTNLKCKALKVARMISSLDNIRMLEGLPLLEVLDLSSAELLLSWWGQAGPDSLFHDLLNDDETRRTVLSLLGGGAQLKRAPRSIISATVSQGQERSSSHRPA